MSRPEPPETTVVHILLATHRGAAHLREQLASLARQTHRDWRLHVSDDASTDATLAIVADFRAAHPDRVAPPLAGPGRGFVANFLALACRLAAAGVDGCFAFCDQDDIWLDDKLERALERLRAVPAGIPALYCGRTRLIDDAGRPLGLSPLFRKKPSFANALVQSIAGGNTMVFNRAALDALAAAGPDARVPSHDWWLYLLVAARGGVAIYDPVPAVLYRQHRRNLVGANVGLGARMRRMRRLIDGQFKRWTDSHLAALRPLQGDLPAAQRRLLAAFRHARQSANPFARAWRIGRSGVYRQTAGGAAALRAAAFLGKL